MSAVAGHFLDGFETYGTGAASNALLLSGVYAELIGGNGSAEQVAVPAWGPRSGLQCLNVNFTTSPNGAGVRKVLDTSYAELMVSFAYSCSRLPSENGYTGIFQFRTGANVAIATLVLQSTGRLALMSGDVTGTVMVQSAAPVVRTQAWQWFELYVDLANGIFKLFVDNEDVPVIDATGLTFTASSTAQVVLLKNRGGAGGGSNPNGYMDDLWIRKLETPGLPDFKGDISVATLYTNADTDNAGWEPHYRKKLGTGIIDTRAATNACVSAAQSPDFNLGSGDFTLEGFVRFSALPTGSNIASIWSKWIETGNLRSYQLMKCGPSLNAGALVFRISTDGTAGSVQNIIAWPWEPEIDEWHFLTIERVAGETTLYIDGIAQGLASADVNTYATISAPFAIHAQMSGTSTALVNTGLNGFGDELRVTVGAYRYDGDFTPPVAPFPTTLGGDPLFANVAILGQWDNGVVDSSLHARSLTARNGAVQNTPDDGQFAFQTIDNVPPRDDTFVQASLTRASGQLIFGANPAAATAVVLGADTYTFVAALVSAYDVLIGADAEESINNLIAAINGDAGEGTIYGTGTLPNNDIFGEKRPSSVMEAYAIVAGTAGNALASTTTVASASWSAATLLGGVDIPGPSDFEFQRLPYDATEVFAVGLMTRGYKTAAGTVKMRSSLIGPQGGVSDGAETALTTNPTFHQDVFTTDPDGGPLTPSTIVSAKIRLDRTE